MPLLTHLELGSNHICGNGAVEPSDMSGVTALAQAVCLSDRIRHLGLAANQICGTVPRL